jgi:hypothetical protein
VNKKDKTLRLCALTTGEGESSDGLGSAYVQGAAATCPGVCHFLLTLYPGLQHPIFPLSAFTSPKVLFTCPPAAAWAFQDFKHCFTTAPILVHPDASRQFGVEEDASDIGVGEVLSQCSALDLKLHSCTFFSHIASMPRKGEPETILPTLCLATALS